MQIFENCLELLHSKSQGWCNFKFIELFYRTLLHLWERFLSSKRIFHVLTYKVHMNLLLWFAYSGKDFSHRKESFMSWHIKYIWNCSCGFHLVWKISLIQKNLSCLDIDIWICSWGLHTVWKISLHPKESFMSWHLHIDLLLWFANGRKDFSSSNRIFHVLTNTCESALVACI